MAYRSDYSGPQPPVRLRSLLTKVGGLNLFGSPVFRLVHSAHRRTPSAGSWVDWPEMLTTNERSDAHNTPIRRVVETRMVLLYPNVKGWVLEKWCEPQAYGTPEVWYKPISMGGTMMYIPHERRSVATLGEYPTLGDYENMSYLFPTEALTESVMMTALGRNARAVDAMPATPEGRVLRRCYQATQAEELKQRTYRAYAAEVMDETDFAFNGSPFAAMGTIKRPHSSKALLRKLGIQAHYID